MDDCPICGAACLPVSVAGGKYVFVCQDDLVQWHPVRVGQRAWRRWGDSPMSKALAS